MDIIGRVNPATVLITSTVVGSRPLKRCNIVDNIWVSEYFIKSFHQPKHFLA